MLKHLYIKNFALIDSLDMDFEPGFSVVTGETGAGKSIILGAIALLLGQRADSKAIKQGTTKCTIEAHFDLTKYDMGQFFQENDIDYDPADCILRRELTAAGKSRAFINDTPVPLTTMRQLGSQLVDVHSQHQNLMLQDGDFQMGVLDIIGNNHAELAAFKSAYTDYLSARQAVATLRSEMEEAQRNADFMRFQLKELKDAMLTEGMQAELEQESETLSHVEDIKQALYVAEQKLSGSEQGGIVGQLREAQRAIAAIADVFAPAAELADRLESCYIETKDIEQEIGSQEASVDFDPQRQQEVDDQLSRIYSLQKKHGVDTVEELMAIREKLEQRLGMLDNSSDELSVLEKKEQQALDKCNTLAAKLSDRRAKAARKVEKELTNRLVPLGIPKVRFAVDISQKALSADGKDKVNFLFSANTSTALQPISEVASGGEIARVMLSLKAMISGEVKLPTIIFDEVDTGVSGKIAEMMATIMMEMGQNDRQVISITHLPQIAARGRVHYKVYKEETDSGTISLMKRLDAEERVMELAQMLSGSEVTDAAVANARELLRIEN